MSLQRALDTYRGHTVPHFRFSERRNIWFTVSGVVILMSLVGFFVRGLNYSIDFKGGSELTYSLNKPLSADQVEALLMANGHPNSTVQLAGGGSQVTVRTEAFTTQDERTKLLSALASEAGIQPGDINEKTVGATWGSEISQKAVRGLIVVLLGIGLYISLRFEWKMAGGAMIALVHDLLITGGIYALTGRQVTPETVIAILTILGFSLYDTVVIYDKIKENTESTATVARLGYTGVVDQSLNQVLMRSVNTSLVVLLPILSLLFFGGATLKDFAFAMFIGVTTGAYSSIFIAAPILASLKGREDRFRQLEARRLSRETGGRPRLGRGAAPVSMDGGEPVATASAREIVADSPVSSEAAATRAVARAGAASRSRPKSRRKPPAKRRRR